MEDAVTSALSTSDGSAADPSEGSEPQLVGNALCLDFANTVNSRVDADRDWIAEPSDLDTWARQVGIAASPAESVAAVHALRDSVYRVFHAVVVSEAPARSDLDHLTSTYAEAVHSARLSGGGDGGGRAAYALDWTLASADRKVRWAVADSAVELLRHGPLERVGECPSCGWLFLDTSRNGRRRWCSMAMCGNRVKSARHYARTTAGDRG
jgi:predicted RNA-binding Zn ribbon-like protein